MKSHKHSEAIVAWAYGKEIEIRYTPNGPWETLAPQPTFWESAEFRIKPKPDVLKYFQFDVGSMRSLGATDPDSNLCLTFDGTTGELKSATVK